MSRKQSNACTRDGFSLIELIVAVVLLGAILVTLGGLSFRTARTSLGVANSSARQAVMVGTVNRLLSIDFDSLPGVGVWCDTVEVGSNDFRRCVNTADSVAFLHMRVTVAPLDSAAFGAFAQTQNVSRAPLTAPNPFNP